VPWKERPNVQKIVRQNHELAIQLLRVREELVASQRHRVGLKVALSVREKRIDTLTRRVDQLLALNRKLAAEAERVQMIQLAPPGDAAIAAE
jgi:hypothetical protein